MDKKEDGLLIKTSGRCWVDLVHSPTDTIVCKSLTVVEHTKAIAVLRVPDRHILGQCK